MYSIGVLCISYPTAARLYYADQQTTVATAFEENLNVVPQEELEGMREAAEEYNASLSYVGGAGGISPQQEEIYNNLLTYNETSAMGIVVIPKINVNLPIYHGTDQTALQVGVGHIASSSLPIGGKGTHCVLSAHSGMADSTMFDQLDRLEIGDTFSIISLGETLVYQVDQIKVVLPEETEDLFIDPNQDYCTLITCTPYGVNSHRLLVRGVRVENTEEVEQATLQSQQQIEKSTEPDWAKIVLLVGLLASIPLFATILIVVTRRSRRKDPDQKGHREKLKKTFDEKKK